MRQRVMVLGGLESLTEASPRRAPFAMIFEAARGAHGPAHRCLVARMVDTGNPVTPTVGPIVREGGPTPRAVIPDDETVGDRATVANRYRDRVARPCLQRDTDGGAVPAESGRTLVEKYAVDS